MSRLNGRYDAFHARQFVACTQRLVVVDAEHLCTPHLCHVAVHRTYAGIVQACTNRKGFLNLAIIVLHHEHLSTMQDARCSAVQGCRSVVGFPAMTARFGQHYFHAFVVVIVVDGACGIATATDACHEIIGVVAARLLLQLPLQFLGDNALHTSNQIGIRMRSHRRTDDIECVGWMAAPVANGLATGIGECHIACSHGMHRGSEHSHTLHVGVLAFDICGTHENFAMHAHQRTNGSRCHAMLAGTSLGDDARLSHTTCQQNLSDSVVDLVRTGVVQVLALQEQTATIAFTHAPCFIEWRRTPHVVFQQLAIFPLETVRFDNRKVSVLQCL